MEYSPATQLLHAASPGANLYFPATHSKHVPPSAPDEPALQTQAVDTELPASELEFVGHPRHVLASSAPTYTEYVPIAQSVHAPDPVSALCFPATHWVHVPPSGPDEPALQVQAVDTELPASEFEFVGHAKHVEAWLAPGDTEYVPISQSTHAVDPASVLYFPASQNKHVSPSKPVDPALQVQSIFSLLASGAWEFVGHSSHTSDVAPIALEY